VFVPRNPLQPNLMFTSKAGAYPSGEPERCFTLREATGLTHKHLTRLEMPATNKHYSLLLTFVNYGRKKFYNIGPWYALASTTRNRPEHKYLPESNTLAYYAREQIRLRSVQNIEAFVLDHKTLYRRILYRSKLKCLSLTVVATLV
jgi:hypothetical protein